MRFPALFILLLFVGIGSASASQPQDDFTLYLVRHAEKQTDQGKDPGLTNAGKFRAHQLAELFQYKDIERIWSTDYKRTRETIIPTVSRLKMKFYLYDPHDLPAFAKQLLDDGNNALVVGHSNTTPELTRLLCHCEISDMDDMEYDLLFVVTVSGDETKVEILRQSSLSERWVDQQ
jgi:broad specificity phosphatase PhoE